MPEKAGEDMPAPATEAKQLPRRAARARRGSGPARRDRCPSAAEVASRPEVNGRGGLEPVRYDDWEVKGIASDF